MVQLIQVQKTSRTEERQAMLLYPNLSTCGMKA